MSLSKLSRTITPGLTCSKIISPASLYLRCYTSSRNTRAKTDVVDWDVSKTSALEAFPHPQHMDGEMLSKAASTAAREGVSSRPFWDAMFDCARRHLASGSLDPRDMALFVSAVTRVYAIKKDYDMSEFKSAFVSRRAYFNSQYFAMMLSSLGKNGISLTEADRKKVLYEELKNRMHEFQGTTEISMVTNALCKLQPKDGYSDPELWKRWGCHIQTRMGVEPFHIRDLSVIANAFAKSNSGSHSSLFEKISYQAKLTVEGATPLEIARILHSFAVTRNSGSHQNATFLRQCLQSAADKLLFHTPAELSTVGYAYGQLLELQPSEETKKMLINLFSRIRRYATQTLHLFGLKELTAMLVTFGRWNVEFPLSELPRFVERANQFELYRKDLPMGEVETVLKLLNSVALLYTKGKARVDMKSNSEGPGGINLAPLQQPLEKLAVSAHPTVCHWFEATVGQQVAHTEVLRVLDSLSTLGCFNTDARGKLRKGLEILEKRLVKDILEARTQLLMAKSANQSGIISDVNESTSSESSTASATESPKSTLPLANSFSATATPLADHMDSEGPDLNAHLGSDTTFIEPDFTTEDSEINVSMKLQKAINSKVPEAEKPRISDPTTVGKGILTIPVRTRYAHYFKWAGYDKRTDDILELLEEGL